MMESDNGKQLITRENIEKKLWEETVKNPYSNSGCLFFIGGAIICGCILSLFWLISSNRAELVSVLCIVCVILGGCGAIWQAMRFLQYANNIKALLKNNRYRIVKSSCIKIRKEREPEETGPDYYGYTCDLDNGQYAVFVVDESTQREAGDPVEIGTPVYTVYIDGIPKLYFSGKQYELSSDLVIEEWSDTAN